MRRYRFYVPIQGDMQTKLNPYLKNPEDGPVITIAEFLMRPKRVDESDFIKGIANLELSPFLVEIEDIMIISNKAHVTLKNRHGLDALIKILTSHAKKCDASTDEFASIYPLKFKLNSKYSIPSHLDKLRGIQWYPTSLSVEEKTLKRKKPPKQLASYTLPRPHS